MTAINDRGYARPEVLISTDEVARRLGDGSQVLIESNEDVLLYSSGHLPGAVEVDWTRDLNDQVRRDYLDREGFERLLSGLGIDRDTEIVFYGDKNNWWACYAYWVFHLFGHTKAKIMDGGRTKWLAEGRELVREVPARTPTKYVSGDRNDHPIRAFRDEVLAFVEARGQLIDVRSPEEYSGERLHMEAYPNEGALRGGHIPGAANVPWARAVDGATGEFRSADELNAIYRKEVGLDPAKDVVVYCRIGERSAHTWFVLTRLLGFGNVRNYDGSWTEWGNLVGAPIEK